MENKFDIIVDDNFDITKLLDLEFGDSEETLTNVNITYTWKEVNTDTLEKLMIFFYNKVMDDNVKLEIKSDFSNLTTDNKIQMLRIMFENIKFLVDESIFETFFNLTKIDATENVDDLNTIIFKDAVEFVDIKLGLVDILHKLIRDFVIYYMSLIAGLTGNRVLHTSSFFELFLSTRKGMNYFGELLTNFALSNMQPINSDELYIVQNHDKIYSSMMLASSIINNLDIISNEISCQ